MSELKRDLHADVEPLPEESEVDSPVTDAANKKQSKRTRFGGSMGRGKQRKKRRLTLAVLPTLLTLGNGVCGLAAIAVATSVNLDWNMELKLLVAGILIFVGMLFDALDGSAARMTGQSSEFGAQLDSLCDAVTFGCAPAVIVWKMNEIHGTMIGEVQGVLPLKLTWAIGVLFALCVLIRLARFNVETQEDDAHDGFEGLPSPAAAGTLAAFMIAKPELTSYNSDRYPERVQRIAEILSIGSHYFIPVLALILAFLMVSRFQYPHVFQQLVRGRPTPHQVGQAMFVVIGAVLLHWLALPIAFCYYAFASPIKTWVVRWRNRDEIAEPL